MSAPYDAEDRQLDRNLRTIGAKLSLPGKPTALQRARWTAAPRGAAADARAGRGEARMIPFRLFRYGAAAAAAVMLGLMFILPLNGTRVEAATILRSLRTSLWQGLVVTLDRVETEGISVDGRVELRFLEPTSLALLMDRKSASPNNFDSLFADIRFNASEDAEPDIAGMSAMIRAGLSRSQQWAFVQIPQLPQKLVEEAPAVQLVGGMLQRGMLFDLGDALKDVIDDLDAVGRDLNGAADDSQAAGNSGVSITIREDDGTVRDARDVDLSPDDSALKQLVLGLLRGELTQADLAELVAQLDEHAGNVELIDEGEGRFRLVLSGIKDDPELRDTVIEIGYQDGAGVEAISISNVGDVKGVVRVAFVADVPDSAGAAWQELVDAGVSPIDVAGLMNTFGGALKLEVERK